MTLKAYLDNIQAKTGKTPQDFRILAEEKGLLKEGVKTGQIVSWLKEDYGLGQGHAMAIVLTLRNATQPRLSKDEQVAKHFKGDKARWLRAIRRAVGQDRQIWAGYYHGAHQLVYQHFAQREKAGGRPGQLRSAWISASSSKVWSQPGGSKPRVRGTAW